tara:strand:- start:4664 stop:5524 length:861 start_codon:yes stop_codon:yes gene_type:complete
MGGNIFKGYAKPIVRENVRPTMSKYIEHLGFIFPKKAHVFKNFYPVGSVGKKEISGDLDLALDFKHLFDDEPYNTRELGEYRIIASEWQTLYKKIKSRARTSTDDMCKLKAFLKLLAHPIASEGMIHVADDKTTNGNIFTMFPQYDYYRQRETYVQIDWMVGDLPWLKFAYHSGESGSLKGLHRTQLMVAMLSNKGYTFSHLHGIKDKKTNKFVAKTPEQAVELFNNLFGKLNRDDFHNFLRLHHFVELYSSKEEYEQIIKSYLKILHLAKARTPMVLQGVKYENS